jgi:hypothetical protein
MISYKITTHDIYESIKGGFSGLPYSRRHFKAENQTLNPFGHRIIGLIEAIPILGLLVAIIEAIVATCLKSKCNPTKQDLPISAHSCTTNTTHPSMSRTNDLGLTSSDDATPHLSNADVAQHLSTNDLSISAHSSTTDTTQPSMSPTIERRLTSSDGATPHLSNADVAQHLNTRGVRVTEGQSNSSVSSFVNLE